MEKNRLYSQCLKPLLNNLSLSDYQLKDKKGKKKKQGKSFYITGEKKDKNKSTKNRCTILLIYQSISVCSSRALLRQSFHE